MLPTRLWAMMSEPKIVTAAMGGTWLIILAIGTAALFTPPMTITHELGGALTVLWAILLLLGGAFGLIGCLPGWWWVERAGIYLAATGMLVYLIVVLSLHYTQPGSRLVQAGFILAAVSSMVVRWLRIRGAQLDPTRGMAKL